MTEAAPLEPHPSLRGSYTQSKLEAEQSCSRRFAIARLRAVIVAARTDCRPGSGDGAAIRNDRARPGDGSSSGQDGCCSRSSMSRTSWMPDRGSNLAGHGGLDFSLVDRTSVTQNDYIARCRSVAAIACGPCTSRAASLRGGAAFEVLGRSCAANAAFTLSSAIDQRAEVRLLEGGRGTPGGRRPLAFRPD